MKSVQKNVKNGLRGVYASLKDIHKPNTVQYTSGNLTYVNDKTGREYQEEWQESKWSLYHKTSNLKDITQTPDEEFPMVRNWHIANHKMADIYCTYIKYARCLQMCSRNTEDNCTWMTSAKILLLPLS